MPAVRRGRGQTRSPGADDETCRHCGGTGAGVIGITVWSDPITVCFRSNITVGRARFVALHELQHVKLFRILGASGSGLDAAEARLAQLFDTSGLRKSAGSYPRLEIVADCGVYLATGAFDPGAYTFSCDDARLGAARAIAGGQLP